MIPEYAINEWRNTVHWVNLEQIEQVRGRKTSYTEGVSAKYGAKDAR